MPDSSPRPPVISFGVFEVDLRSGELRRNGLKIKLQEQPFQILTMLLERPGEVVSREEIQKKLWSEDTFVDFEHSLATAVKKLREALGDSADNPRFVETLPRRGYRFIAPLDVGAGLVPALGPDGAESAQGCPRGTPLQSRWLAALGAGAIVLAFAVHWLTRPLPPPKVLRTVQLSNSGRIGWWTRFVEPVPNLAVGGSFVYLTEVRENRVVLAYVPQSGGETQLIALPAEIVSPSLFDISRDGSKLLIGNSTPGEGSLWVVPVVGRTAQRVGNVLAHDATWSPDGQGILYAQGHCLFVTRDDGTEPRKFAEVGGRAFQPRWSPDGRRLRFTVRDPQTGTSSLWETSADGTNLHPLLPGWNQPPAECCGNWTPDGRFFVFSAERNRMMNIWVLHEQSSVFGKNASNPAPLTAGPLQFTSPAMSADGKRVFTLGIQVRSELVRFDLTSRHFTPLTGELASLRPDWVDCSRDGQWITYVEDGVLWRSRADGRQRLQLTSLPLETIFPAWSPDGEKIAFAGKLPGKPWKIHVVSRDGGTPEQLTTDDRNETDPDWSPDGRRIVFGRMPDNVAESSVPKAIHIFDLTGKETTRLPGSDELFDPRWSPDGRYIVAQTLTGGSRLMLFDFETQKWGLLLEVGGIAGNNVEQPVWSRDGTYIYFAGRAEEGEPVYRLRLQDRKLERLFGPEDIRRGGTAGVWWRGMGPDDLPLVRIDNSASDLYALDWEAP